MARRHSAPHLPSSRQVLSKSSRTKDQIVDLMAAGGHCVNTYPTKKDVRAITFKNLSASSTTVFLTL